MGKQNLQRKFSSFSQQVVHQFFLNLSYTDATTIFTIIIYIFSETFTYMSNQESKGERICDLLNALVTPKVKCASFTTGVETVTEKKRRTHRIKIVSSM